MSTMPPISSSRSAPVTVTSSPASCIWASQARKSCLGALRVARSAVRGAAVFNMANSLAWRAATASWLPAGYNKPAPRWQGSFRLAVGNFDDLRIDGDFESRQKAHSQQTVDAVTKSGLGVVLNHNGYVLGLQRAELNCRRTSELPVGNAIRGVEAHGAALIATTEALCANAFLSETKVAPVSRINTPRVPLI